MNTMLQHFWVKISVDRKRFGLLLVVVLVGLLMWARIIIIERPPRRAIADPPDPALIPGAASDTNRSASDNPPSNPLVVALTTVAARDPFRVSTKHFPKPTIDPNPSQEVVELPLNHADEVSQEAQRTAHLREVAEQFVLEAVMKGGPAVIDGRTVMLGEEFTSEMDKRIVFVLVEIGARWVNIEADGHRFQLRMASFDHIDR